MTLVKLELDVDLTCIHDTELLKEIRARGYVPDKSIDDFDSVELQKELEKRDYYVFDYDPTGEDVDLDEVEISDMAEHLSRHGYKVIESDKISDLLSDLPPYKLKDLLCNVVGVNHHTNKEDILKLIGEKL